MTPIPTSAPERAAERAHVPVGDEQPMPLLESLVDAAMSSLRIGVVYGGDSTKPDSVVNQRPGIRSSRNDEAGATDIADSLRRLGFRHVRTMPEDMHLGDRLRRDGIQLAWIYSAGVQGQNPLSHAPALLELLGIAYVGHDPLNAGTLDNKHLFKRSLIALGLQTAPFVTWHMARGAFRPKINSRFVRSFKNHWGAFVVKPVCGSAATHVHVVDDEGDLPDAVADVFAATDNHVLIEAFLPGPEYCVSVGSPCVARRRRLHGRSEPFVFSPIERLLPAGERIARPIDAKSIPADRFKHVALEVQDDVGILLHELGRAVFLDFNLEGPIRLDVRANAAGVLSILEANPRPDLERPADGATSLVCSGLALQDMDYDDLILTLIAGRLAHLREHRPFCLPPSMTTA